VGDGMTVFLKEIGATGVSLDFGEDTSLKSRSDIQEALMAFMVIDRSPSSVTLDVSQNIIEAVVFLTNAFSSAGVSLKLSPTLERILSDEKREREILSRATASDLFELVQLPEQIPGFIAGVNLLSHQARGLKKALFIENLAEFSVQGSGKTLIALAAFRIWQHQGLLKKLLVIGPTSSRKPWEDEIRRWLGQTPVLRWSGSALQRTRLVPLYNKSEIILCSYDTAIRDSELLSILLKDHPTLLVLDESHYIKNFEGGARSEMAQQFSPLATRRMILTGTPAPHSLLDIWNQLAFLWPTQINNLLGSRPVFQIRVQQGVENPEVLGKRLQPFFHRTTQIELHLPEPRRFFIKLPDLNTPPEQARILRLLEARVMSEVRNWIETPTNKDLVLRWRKARITRLLQAASNPGLLSTTLPMIGEDVKDVEMGDLSDDISKFANCNILASKINWSVAKAKELANSGKKVVIWTWWVGNLHLMAKLLNSLNPLIVYGGIKAYQEDWDDAEEFSREKNISDFLTDPTRMILLANPAACAEAISLHRECHDAIYIDRTYNCGQFLQSMNRIHRVGLPEGAVTTYWIPYIDCAIERSVNQRLAKRQEVMYRLLNDPATVLGFDEDNETEIVDTEDEINTAFSSLISELGNGKLT